MRILLFSVLMIMSSIAQAFDVSVTYSWDSNPASDQVTQYQCEYSLNSGAYSPCGSPVVPPANSVTQIVSGVNSGDTLNFHVRACNVKGCSPWSVGASATVPPNLIPNTPTGGIILPMVIN